MGSMGKRFFYENQAAGGDGGKGGGAAGGAAAGGAAGGAQAPFADAAAARTYLADYVPDADVLKGVGDDKVVPFATHVKGKVDGYGKQFPAAWRDLIAGENKDRLKTLERFQSPNAMYDAYEAIRQKMSSGELRAVTPFPEKGTDQDKMAWRAQNGVPETAEDYVKGLKLPEGIKLDDDDKKTVESLSKAAHAANMSPAHVNATVAWFATEKGSRMAARAEAEEGRRMAAEDALRAEWGQDYRGNVGRIQAFLEGAPKGIGEMISGARAPDGSMLLNNPAAAKWLVELARATNPSGVVLPGAGGDIAASVEGELKQIDQKMKTDRVAYNKDEKLQARYRELLDHYQRMNGHAWGEKKAA